MSRFPFCRLRYDAPLFSAHFDPYAYCLPFVVSPFFHAAFNVLFIVRLCSLRPSFVQGNIAAAALMRHRAITYFGRFVNCRRSLKGQLQLKSV